MDNKSNPILLGVFTVYDSGKKIDTMANAWNLAGNPICVVMDNTNLAGMKYWSV